MQARVLLVDDLEDLLFLCRTFLESLTDVQVRTARSGPEALEVLHEWYPDLIITDLIMPAMSGLELVSRVRSLAPCPPPTIVALSGSVELGEAALRRGARAFHLKPIDAGDLTKIVRTSLDLHTRGRYRRGTAARVRRARRASSREGGR